MPLSNLVWISIENERVFIKRRPGLRGRTGEAREIEGRRGGQRVQKDTEKAGRQYQPTFHDSSVETYSIKILVKTFLLPNKKSKLHEKRRRRRRKKFLTRKEGLWKF